MTDYPTKVENFLTYIGNKADEPYLRTKLLDVNMRLFSSSATYNKIVKDCCAYIAQLAITKMEGYSLPFGMSGANVGIPFNIIAVVKFRGMPKASALVMINPKIIWWSEQTTSVLSNCGSIRLEKPIPVRRYASVRVEWYDTAGVFHTEIFAPHQHGFTIQHEVDHNLGILITDRLFDSVEEG